MNADRSDTATGAELPHDKAVMLCATALVVLAGMTAGPEALAQTMPQLYLDYCAICHLPGIAGAPKVGDRTEWTRRVRAGLNSIYRNALDGRDRG